MKLDTFHQINKELVRAREKFPDNKYLLTALVEEVGEVAKAFLEKKPDEVISEAIQVAAVAIRILEENDPIYNYE